MWFHFCTVNHNVIGRATLHDMAAWFEAGLLDLGHRVTFSDNSVEPGAINIFWECFDPASSRLIHEANVTYGIIATEIPDGTAFNWRTELEWQTRFSCFQDVAANAKFIWCMVEATVPFYTRFCPSAFVELGFSERLIPDYKQMEPEFDFSFFGLRTPYRLEVAEKLSKYARFEWPESFLTPAEIKTLIGKSRVGLNFKQSALWPVPSPTRLGRFLMARRDLACEWVPTATRQGEIVSICPAHTEFPDFCLDRLQSNWRARADAAFEKYRTLMPMRQIMEKAIDTTCAETTPTCYTAKAIRINLPERPLLIKSTNQWNIVKYGNMYFAIHQSIGVVQLQDGVGSISAHNARFVRWGTTIQAVEAKIQSTTQEFPQQVE